MLVDTHCHVHFNAYKDDMDDVIKRTLAKGVLMVTVGTQSTTSANGIALAEKYDGIYAAVGL
ncbi:hydrolase TatD, partial [bacterium]|nr:hydrolase TatD [bacterium]